MARHAFDHGALSATRARQYAERHRETHTSITLLAGERPVDLHVHDAELDGEPMQVLLTDGLSDAPIDGDRFELVWYLSRVETVHVDWLRFLSVVALTDDVDLFERIIPMAAVPSLRACSSLSSVTFRRSILACDGDPIILDEATEATLYWVIPVTEAERAHLNAQRATFGAALSAMLQHNRHPLVLDSDRPSYA